MPAWLKGVEDVIFFYKERGGLGSGGGFLGAFGRGLRYFRGQKEKKREAESKRKKKERIRKKGEKG